MSDKPKKQREIEPVIIAAEHGPYETSYLSQNPPGYVSEVVDKYYIPDEKREKFKEEHLDQLTKTSKELNETFEKLAKEGKTRTIFIETDRNLLQRSSTKEALHYHEHVFPDPWILAIHLANKYGWRIFPLDSKLLKSISGKSSGEYLESNYIDMNMREAQWAAKFKKHGHNDDIVLMHPGHVEGFLNQSGIKGTRVVWVDKSKREYDSRRLIPHEVNELRKRRNEMRDQRIKNANSLKTTGFLKRLKNRFKK